MRPSIWYEREHGSARCFMFPHACNEATAVYHPLCHPSIVIIFPVRASPIFANKSTMEHNEDEVQSMYETLNPEQPAQNA